MKRTVFFIITIALLLTSVTACGSKEANTEQMQVFLGKWSVVSYEHESGLAFSPNEVDELAELFGRSGETKIIESICFMIDDVEYDDPISEFFASLSGDQTILIAWVNYVSGSHQIITDVTITETGIMIGSIELVWEEDSLVIDRDDVKMTLEKDLEESKE